MALVNVIEKWSGREGGKEIVNVLGAQTGNAARRFTVAFTTKASFLQAINATGIPDIGDIHPDDTWMMMRRKRAVPLGPRLWEVTCEYAGKDSPLLQAAEKSWQEASSTEGIETDAVTGQPIVNSVGDPFEGLTVEIADPVYVFTRNEATYPVSTMYAYWNAVNSDTVLGIWPSGTCRMLPITAVLRDDGTYFYYAVTYRLQFRKDGWKMRIRNEGKQYRDVPGGPLVSVQKKIGIEKALLRANGTLLNGTGTTGAEPVIWLQRNRYKSIAFGPLNIF